MSSIVIAGDTSGTCTLQAANVAGNTVLNLPTTSGTLVSNGDAPSFTTVTTGLGNATAPSITFTGDTNTGIFSPTADTIAFTEGGVEAMRIDASGRVGIGETAPNNTLSIKAPVATTLLTSSTGTNTVYTQYTNTGGSFYVGRDNSTGGTFGATYGSYLYSEGAYPLVTWINGSERMRITSGGNVGIGTNNPGGKLDVIGTSLFRGTVGGRALRIAEGGVTTIGFDIEADTNAGDLTLSSANGSGLIAFKTAGSERMRITSTGLLQFNSGYGSVATAYGCRAWISFNGSSGAINGSGNISSVSNNATGDWTINFSTSMPDGNYSIVGMVRSDNDVNPAANPAMRSSDSPAAGSCRVMFGVSNSRIAFTLAMFAVFR